MDGRKIGANLRVTGGEVDAGLQGVSLRGDAGGETGESLHGEPHGHGGFVRGDAARGRRGGAAGRRRGDDEGLQTDDGDEVGVGGEIQRSTSNYYLFDPEGHIQHYRDADAILDAFLEYRLPFYQKRREAILKGLHDKLCFLSNKARFLKAVNAGTLQLHRPLKEVEKDLAKDGIAKWAKEGAAPSYEYLLNIPLSGLTQEKCEELKKNIHAVEESITRLNNQTSKDLWINDLEEFRDAFIKVGDIWTLSRAV